MTKIRAEDIVCQNLKRAYSETFDTAFDDLPMPDMDTRWNSGEYGNQVTTVSSTTGTAYCGVCGRECKVEFIFNKIKASNVNTGKPVTLYSAISDSHTINVSGSKCTKEPNQR